MIKQTLMIQGKDSLSLDFASLSLILLYSSMETCLFFFEWVGVDAIVLIV